MARVVRNTRNAIGYVEYSQAQQAGLTSALLQNRSGRFVRPDASSFLAAAGSADWKGSQDFHLLLTDASGDQAYPITATVFIQIHRKAPAARIRATLDFFRWVLEHGAGTASQLGCAPLPASLIRMVEDYWTRSFQASSSR